MLLRALRPSVELHIEEDCEKFWFADSPIVLDPQPDIPITFPCDKLGYVLDLILGLDCDAVLSVLREYDSSKDEDRLMQDLLRISEVFRLYLPDDAEYIAKDFKDDAFEVRRVINRLKGYMAFCEQKQIPYQNEFYDYLRKHAYIGYLHPVLYSDKVVAEEDHDEHGFNSNYVENLDVQYEIYLKAVEKRKRILPRTYHIDSAYNVLVQVAVVSFDELARRKKILRKCANCGHYFVPENRSDTLYCDRVSPQEPAMDCKTYASQRLWYQKQKLDELAVLSRNVLSAKGMLASRNPDIPAYRQSYDYFRKERLKWKAGYETGEISAEDYRSWLLRMREQKIIKETLDGNN